MEMGYHCPMVVVPILIPFADYKHEPDLNLMRQLEDGNKNIIFTGRIVPNKRQEDLIKIFYYYQRYYDANAKLHLVGNYTVFESYYQKLIEYVDKLQVKNINFTGHVSFAQILSYYNAADLFLCMSDHEGFCVPLVEAMQFGVPIIAKDTTAISSTLGKSGFLIKELPPQVVAGIMYKILNDKKLSKQIVMGERERLTDFDHEKIGQRWLETLKEYFIIE